MFGTGLSFHEPVHVVLIFQYFIKRRTIFFDTPCIYSNVFVYEDEKCDVNLCDEVSPVLVSTWCILCINMESLIFLFFGDF